MINRILASIAVIVLAFTGLQFIDKNDSNCINLYIDYGPLDSGTKLNKCIDVSTKIVALDLLEKANIKIEGTNRYGLDVVCRVNGLPNRNMESCDVMPPENAYWAVLIKEKQSLPFPTKEWGWSQLAINQQYLKPGDSLGLVFADKGEIKFP
jgi:hypothetical protein